MAVFDIPAETYKTRHKQTALLEFDTFQQKSKFFGVFKQFLTDKSQTV